MTSELMALELRRDRWRRARQSLLLLDPSAEDFGTGGLASFVADRSVRLLILPADPEASLIDFDERLWKWWRQAHTDPIIGDTTQWGTQHRTISAAVVSFDSYREQGWERYCVLHRHGGLELELGSSATYTFRERRGFRLIYTVGTEIITVHLGRIERGMSYPRPRTRRRLAGALGVEPKDLLREDG